MIKRLSFFLGFFCLSSPVAYTAPLSFDQAVQEGLRSNLDLIAAKYSVPMAEADALTAGLWNNPSLIADTIFQPFGHNWDQTSAGGPRQYDIGLSYPFDLSGKISSARKSAKEAVKVSEAAFQDAVRLKVRDIRLAYIDVITFQNQWKLSQEKEANLRRLVEVLENRIGRQHLLPLVQRRAQLARDQAALETRQKESALRGAKTNLAMLLGRASPEADFEASTGLRDFEYFNAGALDALVAQAQNQRPDLKSLQFTVSKSKLDEDLAHAQAFDNVTLTASFSTQGPNDANPHDPTSAPQARGNSWSASVNIPLPLFNRSQGNVKKALAAGDQARAQVDALKLSIRQELAALLDQLALNRSLIEDYESKQLDVARQVRDAQQRLLGTGGSVLLDYFDAVAAYQTTLSSYYDTVGEYRRDLVRLSAALGKDAP